jgi:hypothetical protein
MQFSGETKALFQGLMNPPRRDLIALAQVPEIGDELALAHVALMREAGEPIPASILALEKLVLSRGIAAIDMGKFRKAGFRL